MKTTALFVYGTLTNTELVAEITGHRLPARPACLNGYARTVPDEGFPFITPCAGAQVDGLLLEGIDLAALARLDAYEEEGHLYHRRPVVVCTAEGPARCETYVGNRAVRRAVPRPRTARRR